MPATCQTIVESWAEFKAVGGDGHEDSFNGKIHCKGAPEDPSEDTAAVSSNDSTAAISQTRDLTDSRVKKRDFSGKTNV